MCVATFVCDNNRQRSHTYAHPHTTGTIENTFCRGDVVHCLVTFPDNASRRQLRASPVAKLKA